MANKPTDLPEWATDTTADVVEPPAAKKHAGWIDKEKPPHGWFNWLFNLLYQWAAFVQDYSANHVHDGGSSDLSAPKVDAESEVDWGALISVDKSLGSIDADSFDAADLVSTKTLRIDSNTYSWTLEDDATYGLRLRGYNNHISLTMNDNIVFSAPNHDALNPRKSYIEVDYLKSDVTAKAFCNVISNGSISGSAFNVTSATKNSTGYYTVTFDNIFTIKQFDSFSAVPVYTSAPTKNVSVALFPQADNTCDVYMFDSSDTAIDCGFCLTVHQRMTNTNYP